ncbi:MAG: nicotinate-nucleotide adenylyltransferase [Actinomycetia bacterium]|nr:nicotinate-nucleotide adenylyltransferase [Actinomycetes bacterium]
MAAPRPERLGILGGTFDPVHIAHIVSASECKAVLGLDRVDLVVAGDPWQKRGDVLLPAETRLELVELAVDGVEGVAASGIEVERSGPTYTVDTLEALAAVGRELFLILGADLPAALGSWHRVERIRELATLVVVTRAGDRHAVPPGEGWRVEHVDIPRLDVSSTDIRARLAAGRPIDGIVPAAVVRRIAALDLYTPR